MQNYEIQSFVLLTYETYTQRHLPKSIRGNHFKLQHQLSHLARRKFVFPVRIVEPWNKLPPEVVDSVSEEICKLRIDGVSDTMFVP